jgi:hypothetical protein
MESIRDDLKWTESAVHCRYRTIVQYLASTNYKTYTPYLSSISADIVQVHSPPLSENDINPPLRDKPRILSLPFTRLLLQS